MKTGKPLNDLTLELRRRAESKQDFVARADALEQARAAIVQLPKLEHFEIKAKE